MDRLGQPTPMFHEIIMLRAVPRDADRIAFLKGVSADEMCGHLAAQHDDGNGVHHGVGERRDQIRHSGAGSDEHDTWPSRGSCIAFSRVGGCDFVSDLDMSYPTI
ncbi:hypothetical protein K426_28285 (plasmid) [Sphingobium sp. TKS]|nr:hypothetical protein K426_28285 [Sphingobium sp. TKS]